MSTLPSRQSAERRDSADAAPSSRTTDAPPGTLLQRWLWFGALWLAGVSTVSVVAYGIRAMIL